MAIKQLKPKSRKEIIDALWENGLDGELLEIIRDNIHAYNFVASYISKPGLTPEQFVEQLNGLVAIIRLLK